MPFKVNQRSYDPEWVCQKHCYFTWKNSTQTHSHDIFTLCTRCKLLSTLHVLWCSHSSAKSVKTGTAKKKHSKTAKTKAKWFRGNSIVGTNKGKPWEPSSLLQSGLQGEGEKNTKRKAIEEKVWRQWEKQLVSSNCSRQKRRDNLVADYMMDSDNSNL